jgi:medium-chain acyl-[acyl-carrier-protein] hydrolase
MPEIIEKDYTLEKTYPISYHEVDLKNVLKPSALLNFLQDMATINAEMLGFGPSFSFPNNYAWFLIKYRMEFDKYPENLTKFVIKTEARGLSKLMANRDFELRTSEGERLGRIASEWLLIDLNTKKILPIKKVLDFLPEYQKRENDLTYEKIKPAERVDFEKTFEIRYDDIDVNKHVNNANYIVWAFETLPFEFMTTHKMKTLDILYKKEIAYGHNVISQVEFNNAENRSIHVLKNAETEEELCFVSVKWE